jgi:circadian clock protein KaiC
MLAIGAAGVGKSSLCHQYCMAALARGEYFAWFSFDERMETMFKRATSMGMDFEAAMEAGKCSIEQVDPGSLSPGEFIQRVRRQVERFGARMVVIDSLNGYLGAMPGERFLVLQMHELLNYMAQMGVLSLIVIAQHGLLGGVHTEIDLSYLADTVAYLRYFEHAGQVRRAISIMKKRGAVHEEFVREYQVTPTGLKVGQPLHEFKGVLTGQPEYVGPSGSLLLGGQQRGAR